MTTDSHCVGLGMDVAELVTQGHEGYFPSTQKAGRSLLRKLCWLLATWGLCSGLESLAGEARWHELCWSATSQSVKRASKGFSEDPTDAEVLSCFPLSLLS